VSGDASDPLEQQLREGASTSWTRKPEDLPPLSSVRSCGFTRDRRGIPVFDDSLQPSGPMGRPL